MVLSAYAKLRESYNRTIIIDKEDTNMDSYVAHDIPGDLLIKNKNTLFKCTDLVSSNIANVLILFHVVTGCDHTFGFFWTWKEIRIRKASKRSGGTKPASESWRVFRVV